MAEYKITNIVVITDDETTELGSVKDFRWLDSGGFEFTECRGDKRVTGRMVPKVPYSVMVTEETVH